MVAIPLDIIYNIVEAIGDDESLLKACALVSSSFLLPCRKQLFSRLYLTHVQVCQGLHQVLVENPVLQSFVRSITVDLYEPLNCASLIAILRLPFCSLEDFSIASNVVGSQVPLNWNDFSSELKDTLSTIIHSSTLKTLHLDEISVPTMLFHGINLTKLELSDLSPNEFDVKQSKLLTQPEAAPEGMETTTPHTVIDQCVWNYFEPMPGTRFPTSAYFSLIWEMEGRIEPVFLPFMCRLRFLEIYIDPSSANLDNFDILIVLIHSLLVSLTSPATLEHLKFDIVFRGWYIYDLDFFVELQNADVWRDLDSIITHPYGSRLQRVDIDIQYAFRPGPGHGRNVIEQFEPTDRGVWDVVSALPLLHEKGILFVNATTNLSVWIG